MVRKLPVAAGSFGSVLVSYHRLKSANTLPCTREVEVMLTQMAELFTF